ncbi:RNA methyltransferase [Actinidia chinensis var. chinensis]|uniref:RNA methyltransferase n=1 Tax=Actinidia chinensis var. chinensis TaxID=1590841 RepID=A0A2R6S1F0_ACTCC|nr:RNA methyltransferase [Actinidia chinensis var. chinensis]
MIIKTMRSLNRVGRGNAKKSPHSIGQDLEEDPRLKVLKNEWFESKDCLDIGCNNRTITFAIAKKFGCRSFLGVDIDGGSWDQLGEVHNPTATGFSAAYFKAGCDFIL